MMDLPEDFDAAVYLELHPDVKNSGFDAADHYLRHGFKEGRIYTIKGIQNPSVERYLPLIRGGIALEHLHRYAFACLHVSGKRVLDLASGEGYGSAMLSRSACTVHGVDIDPMSVKHARRKYTAGNLFFLEGSCEEIPLAEHSVDVVVSFETIEHLEDHDRMLQEIRRVLAPEGMLIISSPDKDVFHRKYTHSNPFHRKELTSREFAALMRQNFRNVDLFGQSHLLGSSIFPKCKGDRPERHFRFSDLPDRMTADEECPEATFLLAVCSNGDLPLVPSSFCSQEMDETDLVMHLRSKLSMSQREPQNLPKDTQPIEESQPRRSIHKIRSYLKQRWNLLSCLTPKSHSSPEASPPVSESGPQDNASSDTAHFIKDYSALIDRLVAEYPDNRPLAMARAVGSITMESYRTIGDQQVEVLKRCGLRNGMSVYDLACGSGRTASALIRAGWHGRYKGADIMPTLVNHLLETCPGYEAVVHTDLTITMPDESLDIIFAWSLFTHLLHEESYLYMEDAIRALKPGGVLVFSFLEFEMPGHWGAFENVMAERRHHSRTHMNTFLHRDQITLWSERLGYEDKPRFIAGNDDSITTQGAFWQSLAILRKAG